MRLFPRFAHQKQAGKDKTDTGDNIPRDTLLKDQKPEQHTGNCYEVGNLTEINRVRYSLKFKVKDKPHIRHNNVANENGNRNL